MVHTVSVVFLSEQQAAIEKPLADPNENESTKFILETEPDLS